MTFGDRLRKLRKQMDMTQDQVAKNLNIVRSTYAYYETGKTCPDFSTVVRLAHLFNVTTDYLLDAETDTQLARDTTKPGYETSVKQINEWSLRDSEQRLIVAFRYIDKNLQVEFLNEIEHTASEMYKQRHSQKKEKDSLPTSTN